MGNEIQTAVTAEVATVKSKVLAFVKAHATVSIASSAAYVAGKFGVIGLIFKAL